MTDGAAKNSPIAAKISCPGWDRPSPFVACHASAKRGSRQTTKTDRLSHSHHAAWLQLCRSVLHPFEFFAGRDHSSVAQVRRTQEHSPVRQHWEPRAGRASPGTGRKNPGSGHLSPRSGAGSLATWTQGCAPWASIFRPPGSVRSTLFAAMPLCGAGNPARSRLSGGSLSEARP